MDRSEKTTELLKRVRKIEIKTKGLSNQIFSGGYQSAFKGRGMSFSEVREYQYGDDVRAIDWNVTARFDRPYIKVFEEERELTVMMLIDVSRSTFFGTQKRIRSNDAQTKQEFMTEIAAVLTFSAMNNNDKVGAILFSNKVELFIPPKKGRNHILRIIRELIDFEPKGQTTNIAEALRYTGNMLKKRSIVFILSDYLNTGADYKDALSIVKKRHDVVGIRVFDTREKEMPNVGLVRVEDAETGQVGWLDTSRKSVRVKYGKWYEKNERITKSIFMRSGADLVSINTQDSYITALMNMFQMREKRR